MNRQSNNNERTRTRGVPKKQKQKRPDLKLRPAFPGQPTYSCEIASEPTLITTTVTTGEVALAIAIDPVTLVNAWATRFQVTFREYRVIRSMIRLQMFSSANAGVLSVLPDEKSSTAPTAATAQNQRVLRFNASDVTRTHMMSWVPSDPLDLQYTASATSANPAWWKVYTDAALFGAPIAVTNLGLLTIYMTVQFREFV